MPNQDLLILITFFIVKHFIVDFPLQTKWQYSNKHILFHPGGIFHAFLHGLSTLFILNYFDVGLKIAVTLGVLEGAIHYTIDYQKMNMGIKYNLKADNSEYFWWLLGFDQCLHYLTYVIIVWIALTFI